jgi:hypothetical protein
MLVKNIIALFIFCYLFSYAFNLQAAGNFYAVERFNVPAQLKIG